MNIQYLYITIYIIFIHYSLNSKKYSKVIILREECWLQLIIPISVVRITHFQDSCALKFIKCISLNRVKTM